MPKNILTLFMFYHIVLFSKLNGKPGLEEAEIHYFPYFYLVEIKPPFPNLRDIVSQII